MDARAARTDHTCGLGIAYCRSPVCRSVPSNLIGNPTKTRLLERGERLTMTKDGCRRVWVVLSGLAAICSYLSDGRRQLLELELSGDIVCGLASYDGSDIALRALSDCRICEVSLESLQGSMSDHPELVTDMFWSMHQRLRRSMMQQIALGRLDRTERVCRFLLEMAERIGIKTAAGVEFDLLMTRDDIADYLGLNAETVSRVFSKLKKSGLIAFPTRTHTVIQNLEALQHKAMLAPTPDGVSRFAKDSQMLNQFKTHKERANGC